LDYKAGGFSNCIIFSFRLFKLEVYKRLRVIHNNIDANWETIDDGSCFPQFLVKQFDPFCDLVAIQTDFGQEAAMEPPEVQRTEAFDEGLGDLGSHHTYFRPIVLQAVRNDGSNLLQPASSHSSQTVWPQSSNVSFGKCIFVIPELQNNFNVFSQTKEPCFPCMTIDMLTRFLQQLEYFSVQQLD